MDVSSDYQLTQSCFVLAIQAGEIKFGKDFSENEDAQKVVEAYKEATKFGKPCNSSLSISSCLLNRLYVQSIHST